MAREHGALQKRAAQAEQDDVAEAVRQVKEYEERMLREHQARLAQEAEEKRIRDERAMRDPTERTVQTIQRASRDAEAEMERRRNAVRLSPVRNVGPNGHVSTVFTNRPAANHWEQQAAQRRQQQTPEPVVAPPTLAALGGSSAPPESTIGEDRCVVCYERDKDTVLLPCKCVRCCQQCAKKIVNHRQKKMRNCPWCRTPVESALYGIKL